MRIELTIKNYRCFADNNPARIVLHDDWVAFVGMNNAGKSTLLRFFYEFRPMFRHLSAYEAWVALAQNNPHSSGFESINDALELFHNNNDRPLTIEMCVTEYGDSDNRKAHTPTIVVLEYSRSNHQLHLREMSIKGKGTFPIGTSFHSATQTVMECAAFKIDIAYYIDACTRLKGMIYIGAFRNILNSGNTPDYYDIQIGSAFVAQWQRMQSGNSVRDNIACINVVESIKSLFGFQMLTIQATDGKDTLHIVIDGKPYKLPKLGSGIAQFIITLVNVAVKEPTYVLIDEPELNLHPSLQIDFLTTLAKLAKYGILFSTHSLGLARATADRIYTVQKVNRVSSTVTTYEASKNLPEFLGSMSYASYQAIGFTKVLLVEGVHEVKTIQQFLRMLGKDHQILLLPLGGSSMINAGREHELAEIQRITTDIYALIDSEKDAASQPLACDRAAFKNSCEALGIKCCILDHRATENYFTDAAVKQEKGQNYRALAPHEKLDNLDSRWRWGKQENYRIAARMTWEDMKDTDLGTFLASI